MLSWQKIRSVGLKEAPASLYESPWHLMAILVFSIFFAESAMMALLYLVVPLPQVLSYLNDPRLVVFFLVPALLILFLFPTLVFFVLHPLRKNITERKKTETELRTSREQLRHFSWRLQAAREEERKRIAREIHDELGQVLATLALEISDLEGDLPLDPGKLRRKLAGMSRMTASTIKTVQRVSADLRPIMLDDLGLAAAVQWQVGEFRKRSGIACDLRIELDHQVPDRERATALFRILQEALTNILRHAQATRVSVRLIESESRLMLQVGDNGRGITRDEIAHRHSLGLLGIRERIVFFGGEVRFRGLPGLGTSVKVTIPHRVIATQPAPELLPEWSLGEMALSKAAS
jgi:signal transduction histidine kinase